MLLGLLILSLILLAIICVLLHRHYSYWQRLGVPEIRPMWIVGNLMPMLMQKGFPEFMYQLYNHPEARNEPFVGIYMFHQPSLLIRNPEVAKNILVRDFGKFRDRHSNTDQKHDSLGSYSLFFLKNPAWKEVRMKLSPFFTGTRLRKMFPLIEDVGASMDTHLRQQPLHDQHLGSFDLEAKELCALFTTDVIATVAYGVRANSFKDPNGDFRRHGRSMFKFSLLRATGFTAIVFLPHLISYSGFNVLSAEDARFMRKTINYVMEERERSGKSRNDLIDILIELRRSTLQARASGIRDQFEFKEDVLVAQAILFFTAGFEASSFAMAITMYQLAKDADIQERLRDEIKEALVESSGQVTLQMIESLEYLQMILFEVERIYPSLVFLERECTSDQAYPLDPFSKMRVPKGMPVYIPLYGMHLDPQFYPEPEKFQPERFAPENRKTHTPCTFLPFGLGPHGCIGERFAYIQAKVGLVSILRNHRITTSEHTPQRIELDPKSILMQVKGGIPLRLIRDPLGV
ncbi:hypothetical protein KR038_003358 [Drosophila bunnanda]|nr:hypothetical protein KR038_003358 [Drosophila bunnanda]